MNLGRRETREHKKERETRSRKRERERERERERGRERERDTERERERERVHSADELRKEHKERTRRKPSYRAYMKEVAQTRSLRAHAKTRAIIQTCFSVCLFL